jgi:hypothetical protein
MPEKYGSLIKGEGSRKRPFKEEHHNTDVKPFKLYNQ